MFRAKKVNIDDKELSSRAAKADFKPFRLLIEEFFIVQITLIKIYVIKCLITVLVHALRPQ